MTSVTCHTCCLQQPAVLLRGPTGAVLRACSQAWCVQSAIVAALCADGVVDMQRYRYQPYNNCHAMVTTKTPCFNMRCCLRAVAWVEVNDVNYTVWTEGLTWEQAQDFCINKLQYGTGSLASFHSHAEFVVREQLCLNFVLADAPVLREIGFPASHAER